MMQICHRKEFAQECSKADFSSIIPSFVYVWNVSFASTFYYLLFWFDFINRSFFNYYYSRSIGSGTSKTSSLPLVSDNNKNDGDKKHRGWSHLCEIRENVSSSSISPILICKFGTWAQENNCSVKCVGGDAFNRLVQILTAAFFRKQDLTNHAWNK